MHDDNVHVAITRRVRETHIAEFERALSDFASRSLAEPGTRGVHLLFPAPGSGSTDYGIMRSFASPRDRDAFYETPLFHDWQRGIAHMIEGEPVYRELHGLEAFFRESGPPPRWKMALLTWLAVWPVSMLIPAALLPLIGGLPSTFQAGVIAGGIVVVLSWGAMPLLTKVARAWLKQEKPQP